MLGRLENVVRWVFQNSDSSAGVKSKKVNRVRRNQDTIDAWSAKGSIKSLMAKSDSIPTDSSEILKLLYADQDLLHLSPDIFHDNIMECREWINSDLAKMQYLCPCKFKGKEKGRLAENVAERSFIVFETDERPNDWDGQAGLIERLAQELPLRMVCNKSLHMVMTISWRINSEAKAISLHKGKEKGRLAENVDSFGATKDRIEQLRHKNGCYKMVVTLGGDRAVLRAAQMVRFPLGRNSKTGKKQEVIYFRNG